MELGLRERIMCWCRLASGRWILCRRTEWEMHVGCLESRHVYTVSTLCLDIFGTVRLLFVAEERACWDLSPKVGSMASEARSSCSHGAMVPWCHGNHRTALRSRLRDAKESRGGLGRMMQARTDKSLPLLCHCFATACFSCSLYLYLTAARQFSIFSECISWQGTSEP